MKVVGKKDRSNVVNNNRGNIRLVENSAVASDSDNPMAHEFGHILGLQDRYDDKKGTDEGWEGNIMGSICGEGVVEDRNIRSIVTPAVVEYKQNKEKYEQENWFMSIFSDYQYSYKINRQNTEKR